MSNANATNEVEDLFNSIVEDTKTPNFVEEPKAEAEKLEVTETVTVSIPTEKSEETPKETTSDEEEEVIVEETTEVESASEEEITSSYSTKLAKANLVNNCHELNEFDKMTIVYQKVLDPSGQETDCFTCHCNIGEAKNEDGTKKYETSNSSLSKHYVATSLTDLVAELKQSISISEESSSVTPFMSSWNGITNKVLNLIDNEIEKDMFFIYSGMDADKTFTSNKATIEIYIMNSYNGKSSVFVNYAFSIHGTDSDGKDHKLKDFFTLSHDSNRFLHKGNSIEEISSGLSQIEDNMSEEIDILKAYEPTEKQLKFIGSKLKSGKKKEFLAAYDAMPDKFKNLYYALILLSSKIDKSYNVTEHLMLQPIINKIIGEAHAK